MKYIKEFASVADANTQGGGGLYSPHISIISGKSAVNIYSASTETFTCTFSEDGKLVPPTPTGQPTDEIWYTSTDGNIVEPVSTEDFETFTPIPVGSGASVFGANIASNTYEDGKGIIKFDGDVTNIGPLVYAMVSTLDTITLPNSVTGIGTYTFYMCSSLSSITIPDSVTSIGIDAFEGGCTFGYCTSLSSVTIPNSVTGIGPYVFTECAATELTYNGTKAQWYNMTLLSGWKGNITTIHCTDGDIIQCNYISTYADGIKYEDSISNKSGLLACEITNFITSIENSTFSNCTSLSSVTIPNSVTSIGGGAFYNCTSLSSITIPNSVTSLAGFDGCTALSSITIPNSVTGIGSYTFSGCTSLSSITIPDSVTSIGSNAFQGCTSLSSITIPDSVTSIGSNAFQGCTSLSSVTIPDSVTSIGTSAFNSCTALSSVTIPNSVTSIGSSAFQNCTSLSSVTIPDSVTSIGGFAFSNCISLSSVTIPDSVTSIGSSAFYNCTRLSSVYCNPTTPPTLGDYVFKNNESGRKIYVPSGSVDTYKAASNWSTYASYIVAQS